MIKKILLSIVFVTLLNSCSDDNDVNNSNGQLEINSQNLLGKWYVKGGTKDGGAFQSYNHECNSSRDYQEFLSNNNLDFIGFSSDCVVNDTETSLWSLADSNLTVSNLPSEQGNFTYNYHYTIISLTSSELQLKQIVNEPEGQSVYISYFTRN